LREARIDYVNIARLPSARRNADASDAARLAREWAAGRASGITIVEVSRLLAAAPDRARFVCLDGIHMTEPWHRLMAKEWLKLLVGAREPALEN